MTSLTTRQAAVITGQKPSVFRRWAARHEKRTGVSLKAPLDQWPDDRTPMWDETRIRKAMRTKGESNANVR